MSRRAATQSIFSQLTHYWAKLRKLTEDRKLWFKMDAVDELSTQEDFSQVRENK
jgi:hypothetical protein